MAAGLDPVIAQPTRLQILAYLYRNRQASCRAVAADLGLTPGNLASHLARLEEAGYVETLRALVLVSFEARVRVTARGDEAFRAHVAALRRILDEATGPA